MWSFHGAGCGTWHLTSPRENGTDDKWRRPQPPAFLDPYVDARAHHFCPGPFVRNSSVTSSLSRREDTVWRQGLWQLKTSLWQCAIAHWKPAWSQGWKPASPGRPGAGVIERGSRLVGCDQHHHPQVGGYQVLPCLLSSRMNVDCWIALERSRFLCKSGNPTIFQKKENHTLKIISDASVARLTRDGSKT